MPLPPRDLPGALRYRPATAGRVPLARDRATPARRVTTPPWGGASSRNGPPGAPWPYWV